MNISIYLFGNLGTGYTQYPDDYTHSLFSQFCAEGKAHTQLAIHRNGALMYYAYLRRLDGEKVLGLCCVVNGCYFTGVTELIAAYERVVGDMAREGCLVHYDDQGDVTARVNHLYEKPEELSQTTRWLNAALANLDAHTRQLPPENYSVDGTSRKQFSITDDSQEIVKSSYTYGYTYVSKDRAFNTPQMNSYRGIIQRKSKQIDELGKQCKELQDEVTTLKRKQRNTTWVAVLSIVALVFGVIIWNQVLFPSEVTKKDMGEYVYYGPIMHGKPNGVGVAIYHDGDKDGRRFYYGNFTNGRRVDDKAMLFYNDGSYFYGEMDDDQWKRGIFYDTEQEHFEGEFQDNQPHNGVWYKHVKAQEIKNGK